MCSVKKIEIIIYNIYIFISHILTAIINMNSITEMKVAILSNSVSRANNNLENNLYNYDEITELLNFIKLAENLSGKTNQLVIIEQLIEKQITNEYVLK